MPKLSPFLWFDGNMERAVDFYVSVFKEARVVSMTPMSATFELLGQEFLALNAGRHHKFNEAISFFIKCADQTEVDYYWSKLTAGGTEQPCGWVKDQFGLSWQVIPNVLGQLLGDPDRAKAQRVMQAMLKMRKIVVADLLTAHAGQRSQP
jgi:predicted 3-demethylubiquinone-9 3-methyltransferase (glyoxalase superfamily)